MFKFRSILINTPEHHIAFRPIFCPPLLSCTPWTPSYFLPYCCPTSIFQLFWAFFFFDKVSESNPIFKNGSFLSVVALVSVTLLVSNPSSPEKRSILAPTPSSFSPRTATIELPECQERRGAKTIQSVFFEKASPAEGRRRLHKNTAYAHLWGFSRPFCEHCRPQAGNVQQKGRLKVQR